MPSSSGIMHSRLSYMSKTCWAHYTSCGDVAGKTGFFLLSAPQYCLNYTFVWTIPLWDFWAQGILLIKSCSLEGLVIFGQSVKKIFLTRLLFSPCHYSCLVWLQLSYLRFSRKTKMVESNYICCESLTIPDKLHFLENGNVL